MRNPVEEYQRARSMPIPELEKVMLGQSDAISMAVAHAALKEKLETKVAQQGANAAAQAQAPKVRDKDLEMARGLGGLAGVRPMAGGGEVKRFNAGGQQMSLPGFQAGSTGPSMQSTIRPGAGVTAAQAFPGYTPPAQPSFLSRMGSVAKRGMGALGIGQLALGGDSLNVGEEEYLEMLRRLKALGYTEDQIATMPDEMRRQLASGKAIHSGTAAEPKLGPLTGETTAPPEAAPTGTAQISVPSGSQGLRSLMPKEMTMEDAAARARTVSVVPELAAYGAERLEGLEKRQKEDEASFRKTLIDNKDLFAEARKDLEEGKASSAKEKELDIAAALLKSAATVRKQDLLSGLASLGVDVSAAEKNFNKGERERKRALMDITRAERAEAAGNERAALDFRMKANDKIENAQNDYVKGIMTAMDVDRKTALAIFDQNQSQRLNIGVEAAKLDAAAGRLAAELKARAEERGDRREADQIDTAIKRAQDDYKNLGPTKQMNVDQDDYLRNRASYYLGILKSGKLETGTTQPRGRIVNGVYVQNP